VLSPELPVESPPLHSDTLSPCNVCSARYIVTKYLTKLVAEISKICCRDIHLILQKLYEYFQWHIASYNSIGFMQFLSRLAAFGRLEYAQRLLSPTSSIPPWSWSKFVSFFEVQTDVSILICHTLTLATLRISGISPGVAFAWLICTDVIYGGNCLWKRWN
jgi:hypothetical protein